MAGPEWQGQWEGIQLGLKYDHSQAIGKSTGSMVQNDNKENEKEHS